MNELNDANGMMQKSLVDRVRGILTFDVPTYEEIEADTAALPQAAMVVAAVAACQAIGAASAGLGGFVFGLFFAFVGWLVWSSVSYFIGTRFFGGTATWDQALRVIGYAQAPGLFAIVGILPLIGLLAAPIVTLWTIATVVVGIRQALDLTTGKAVATALVSGAILIAVMAIPITLFGVGMFAMSQGK